MKKTLYLLAFLAITAFPTLTFASFDTSLKYGSRGDAVSELQDFLQDQGYLTGKVDGKFGLGTVRAVKAFQTANNLSADGYFGKGSRAVAQALLAADLKSSDDAEQAETGTISPAVTVMTGCTSTEGFSMTTGKKCDGTFTPAQVSDTGTQSAINSLTQQVQTLTQQLQTQQNPTPTPVVTPPVVQNSITTPEPILLTVTPNPNFTNLTVSKGPNTKIGSYILANPENSGALLDVGEFTVNISTSITGLYLSTDPAYVINYSTKKNKFSITPMINQGTSIVVDIFADTSDITDQVSTSVVAAGYNRLSGIGFNAVSATGQTVTIQ